MHAIETSGGCGGGLCGGLCGDCGANVRRNRGRTELGGEGAQATENTNAMVRTVLMWRNRERTELGGEGAQATENTNAMVSSETLLQRAAVLREQDAGRQIASGRLCGGGDVLKPTILKC